MSRDNEQRLLKALGHVPPEDGEPVDGLAQWQLAACAANGLPPALAPRLTGNTKAGVHADAARLAREMTTEATPKAEQIALARAAAANAARVGGLGVGVRGPRPDGPDTGDLNPAAERPDV